MTEFNWNEAPDGAQRYSVERKIFLKTGAGSVFYFNRNLNKWALMGSEAGDDAWLNATDINSSAKNNDNVYSPSHYKLIDGVESIEIIASSLTTDEWRGFCLGNAIKYRLRCGKKGDLQQDIDKANNYTDILFEKHKHLNRGDRK